MGLLKDSTEPFTGERGSVDGKDFERRPFATIPSEDDEDAAVAEAVSWRLAGMETRQGSRI